MQSVNHQETNGIVIGPELSRIFAEIILQEIDRKVEVKMNKKNYKHGLDYHCSRYIDDYYIYFNDQIISEDFTTILIDELELFKLYLNTDKTEISRRPFISDISIKKLSISSYINDLTSILEADKNPIINSQKEINKIRKILNSRPGENHAITNFFLAALMNRIYIIKRLDEVHSIKAIKLFVDLAFYWIRIDTRVTSIYKLTKLIIEICSISRSYPTYEQVSIFDKLYYEICETLKMTLKNNASIELMNLLIAASELGDAYLIEKDLIDDIILTCRDSNFPDEREIKRLKYFEITTLLYYIKSHSNYDDQKDQIISDSEIVFQNYSVLDYSESAHLLFDLVSCPHLDKSNKYRFVEIAFETIKSDNRSKGDKIRQFINFVQKESWFSNWNASSDLKKILKKKEYMLSY